MMLSETRKEKQSKFKPFRSIVFFIAKIFLLYILWTSLYTQVIYNSTLDLLITENIAQMAVHLLSFLGFQSLASNHTVFMEGVPMVIIGGPCNATEFFGLFACFVIAYPARFVHKAWFIPLGIVFIHLLNIVRVVFLALNLWYSRESFEFNHKYTFIVFLYGLTFLLWVTWVKRFSKPLKAEPVS